MYVRSRAGRSTVPSRRRHILVKVEDLDGASSFRSFRGELRRKDDVGEKARPDSPDAPAQADPSPRRSGRRARL